ncbi:MAG: heavy-metal-associated domain-containing protein [Phycisphaeraceae bacterium]|nr:heavy-metal-associated domain-containing protein [Phycisphaeraceae bacterium]
MPNGASNSATSSEVQRATLTIEGMVCQGCAEAAKQTLSRIDGVVSVETDFQAGTAMVAFDPSKTNVDALAAAIEGVDRDPAPAFRVTARTERQ